MKLSNCLTIMEKDFSIFRKQKIIILMIILLPLGLALGLPLIIWYSVLSGHASPFFPLVHISFDKLVPLIDTLSFIFVLVASILPGGLAAFSIAGEKEEKSLEPLLATPMRDGEILLGKSLSAFLPSIAATLFGSAVYIAFIDVISFQQLGYFIYPNWTVEVFMIFIAPLACLFCVECGVIISARASSIRAAQSLNSIVIFPFLTLYLLGQFNVISLEANNLLIISGFLLLIDVILFFISKATFGREKILTKY
jgi:ABC-2 type transport system permease protein